MNLETIAVGAEPLTVHYFRTGHGEPLLYLHHFLGLLGFEPALQNLAESFDLIAPYAPGWGPAKDDLPRIDPGPLDLVLHYDDFLHALGVAQAHVVGVGIGAWMAAEIAAILPRRVQSLVLINPIGIWLEDAQGEDPFAQHPGWPSQVLFSEPHLRERFVIAERDKVDAVVDELLALRASAKFLWPIMDTGVIRRLPRVTSPTLVVTSENDHIVPPAHGAAWCAALPNAERATIAGAGHLAELEQPAVFADKVTAFINSDRVEQVA